MLVLGCRLWVFTFNPPQPKDLQPTTPKPGTNQQPPPQRPTTYNQQPPNQQQTMSLLNIIENRYSCRAYTDEPVKKEQLDYIKECVRLAPSAVNKQPWVFHIITSEEDKKKVRQCYDREWFSTANTYIIASVLHNEEWVRADGKAHGNIDIAIAVEHLCLAATEQGLATCWVCNFNSKLLHSLFNMEESEEPAVIIPIGYPANDITPKKRKDTECIFK